MRIILKVILLCVIFWFVYCHAGEKDIRVVLAEVVKAVDGDTINVIVANLYVTAYYNLNIRIP